MFGGQAAIRHALADSGADTVVLMERQGRGEGCRSALRRHLEVDGAVEAYAMEVRLVPLAARPGRG